MDRHATRPAQTSLYSSLVPGFELRFQSLFIEGRGFSFPCNDGGHVEIDTLSERARLNYLYARTVVGREFAVPVVRRSD